MLKVIYLLRPRECAPELSCFQVWFFCASDNQIQILVDVPAKIIYFQLFFCDDSSSTLDVFQVALVRRLIAICSSLSSCPEKLKLVLLVLTLSRFIQPFVASLPSSRVSCKHFGRLMVLFPYWVRQVVIDPAWRQCCVFCVPMSLLEWYGVASEGSFILSLLLNKRVHQITMCLGLFDLPREFYNIFLLHTWLCSRVYLTSVAGVLSLWK